MIINPYIMASSGGSSDPSVRSNATTSGVAAASVAVNMPSSIVSGDKLVVAMGHYSGKQPAAPTGWTLHASVNQPSGISREITIYTRTADGTEGSTVTFTFSGGWSESSSVAVSVMNSTGFGTGVTSTSGSTSSTTYTGPTVTITNTGGMLLTAFLQNSTQSGADMVAQVDAGGESTGIFVKTGLSTGTSPAITATAAASQTWAAISMELIK